MSLKNLRLIAIILFILTASAAIAQASAHPSITISPLNISSGITEFPLAGGTWAIDPWETGIGHLQETAWFDAPGNMVLAGHSVMPDGTAGVFYNLNNLEVGQEIVLFDGGGERRYQVTEMRVVAIDDISVVMPTDDDRLTLITCEVSSYDPATGLYSKRLVVVAQRVG